MSTSVWKEFLSLVEFQWQKVRHGWQNITSGGILQCQVQIAKHAWFTADFLRQKRGFCGTFCGYYRSSRRLDIEIELPSLTETMDEHSIAFVKLSPLDHPNEKVPLLDISI